MSEKTTHIHESRQPRLASRRKRPRRLARRLWRRFGILHYRDVPRGWHCPNCLPILTLDELDGEIITRCMAHTGDGVGLDVVFEPDNDRCAFEDTAERCGGDFVREAAEL